MAQNTPLGPEVQYKLSIYAPDNPHTPWVAYMARMPFAPISVGDLIDARRSAGDGGPKPEVWDGHDWTKFAFRAKSVTHILDQSEFENRQVVLHHVHVHTTAAEGEEIPTFAG